MTTAAPLPQAVPLLGLGLGELEAWAISQGQPGFRGRQLHDWIYAKGARSLAEISVLPKAWRQSLAYEISGAGGDPLGRSRELRRSVASDGTTKLLLGTADGLTLETVGIPSRDRLTVCVSSQVGCPMACRFCATGKGACSAPWRFTKSSIRC